MESITKTASSVPQGNADDSSCSYSVALDTLQLEGVHSSVRTKSRNDGELFMMRTALLTLLASLSLQGNAVAAANNAKTTPKNATKENAARSVRSDFQAKTYQNLLGMKGFSDKALTMHFKLYEGYVKNANSLNDKLAALVADGQDKSPEYAGLKRMYGWEYDGMKLHEYYFDSLGGDGKFESNTALARAIVKDFGSYDKWKEDFVATGLIRGIGWAILYWDNENQRLTNVWINEHNLGHLAGNKPILTMDVFEHAYLPDYGLDRAQYIQAFFENLNWKIISDRFDRAARNAARP
ncbi:MAG: superoxide dismutase [Chlamydiales bacterium]|nr:superoxide dismutase [Chlamydiales bacterium]